MKYKQYVNNYSLGWFDPHMFGHILNMIAVVVIRGEGFFNLFM